jgi:hypothetical protein
MVVYNISMNQAYSSLNARFNSFGLICSATRDYNGEVIAAALRAYKRLMVPPYLEQFTVPSSFVVPHGDNRWPPATWGMNLGKVVIKARTCGYYEDFHEDYRGIGLIFDCLKWHRAKTIVLALQTYRSLLCSKKEFTKIKASAGNGSTSVSRVVPIPESTLLLPAEIETAESIASQALSNNENTSEICTEKGKENERGKGKGRGRGKATGISTRSNSSTESSGSGAPFNVPVSFVVPMGSPMWPPVTWGLNLGDTVRRLRNRKQFLEFHDLFRSTGLHL